jgi:hypothetical protein
MNLNPEEELLLLLSRLNPSAEDEESAVNIICGEAPMDYRRFLTLARLNLVSPLLYLNLRRVDGVPGYVMDELKKAYLTTVRNNARHARETMKLIGLLEKAGVEAVPLKGSLASDMIFGDPGLYPTGDIDLLVRSQSMEKAKEALLGAGYRESYGENEADFLESSYHLIFHDGGYSVEVHWNLVKWAFQAPPDFWWEGASKSRYEGAELTLLSPERYLLYATFHLFTHRFSPLKFLVLVSGLITKYRTEMDWDRLLSSAKSLGMKRLVLFTIRLSHDLLGTDVPGPLLNRNIRGYTLLKNVVLSGLFREVTRTYVRLALFTTLLDAPWETARVLLRRIFPPLSEVRLRYGLSGVSKKVYAYYLLNPLLMVIRKR